jgi:hypothetical protein
VPFAKIGVKGRTVEGFKESFAVRYWDQIIFVSKLIFLNKYKEDEVARMSLYFVRNNNEIRIMQWKLDETIGESLRTFHKKNLHSCPLD